MTTEKLHTRVIAGPCVTPIIGGDVARLLKLPDGRGRIEMWKKGIGWVEAPRGYLELDDFWPTSIRPPSAKDAARLGCSLEDFGRHWTEEAASTADRAKIVGLVKGRAWDLAASRMAPGHA